MRHNAHLLYDYSVEETMSKLSLAKFELCSGPAAHLFVATRVCLRTFRNRDSIGFGRVKLAVAGGSLMAHNHSCYARCNCSAVVHLAGAYASLRASVPTTGRSPHPCLVRSEMAAKSAKVRVRPFATSAHHLHMCLEDVVSRSILPCFQQTQSICLQSATGSPRRCVYALARIVASE